MACLENGRVSCPLMTFTEADAGAAPLQYYYERSEFLNVADGKNRTSSPTAAHLLANLIL